MKLHVALRLLASSNSSAYLRGRYEVQVADRLGEPASDGLGAVYGFIAPSEYANKRGQVHLIEIGMNAGYHPLEEAHQQLQSLSHYLHLLAEPSQPEHTNPTPSRHHRLAARVARFRLGLFAIAQEILALSPLNP